MTEFEIAHIKEQGVDLVVVFVDPSVGRKTSQEQNALAAALQQCAASVNWAGYVAMVWPGGFWAQLNQHSFFKSAGGSFESLKYRINKTLSCP